MTIPLLDLKAQYASIREEVLRVTAEVYESQAFILGKRVEEFERNFAAYCSANFCIGVSSGTDALLVALMALEIGPGHEVIVPAYSFFATAGVVDRLGATPVFADINLDDYNIDPAAIEARMTSRTRAIIPVDLYGQAAEMSAINAVAAAGQNVAVVEDAAQAVGAEVGGRRTGSLSELGCFSFFPSKNLGAFGDAGAVTTNDEVLAARLFDLRVHGMRPKYFHRYVGGNFRIDALQAAILNIKLRHLEEWTEGRRRNAARYRTLFGEARMRDRVILPSELRGRRHVFNQYVVRFPDGRAARDRVVEQLRSDGIGCEIYYPLTLPRQACFARVPTASEPYPQSDAAADQTLAIPVYPELTDGQAAAVVRSVGKALDKAD
jgi:dTDP-4-amino-4,6-dideoxygalactose transaminase